MQPILIDYTNWKGRRSIRTIEPLNIWWGSTLYHPEPQWLLNANDMDSGEIRTFAIKDIHEVAKV
jgi:predicted DNA-binding transcriptional regulator YafY